MTSRYLAITAEIAWTNFLLHHGIPCIQAPFWKQFTLFEADSFFSVNNSYQPVASKLDFRNSGEFRSRWFLLLCQTAWINLKIPGIWDIALHNQVIQLDIPGIDRFFKSSGSRFALACPQSQWFRFPGANPGPWNSENAARRPARKKWEKWRTKRYTLLQDNPTAACIKGYSLLE